MKEKFPQWLTVILLSAISFLLTFGIIKIDLQLSTLTERVARIEGHLGIHK